MKLLTLAAYLNHGRWVVDCPFCSGAEIASDKFFCRNCNMEKNQRQALGVLFPKNLILIEKIVSVRPMRNRNWKNETLDHLRAENRAHGLEA